MYQSATILDLIKDYETENKFALYDWQVACSSLIASLFKQNYKLGFMSLPAGTGKSLVLMFASMILSHIQPKKIIIVTSTSFLKK